MAPGKVEVVRNHLLNHLIKRYFRDPAKISFGFCRVTKQGFNLCRAEIARVDLDYHVSSIERCVSDGEAVDNANLLSSLSLPAGRGIRGRRVGKLSIMRYGFEF